MSPIVLSSIILSFAAAVQCLVGFGLALLAVPILLWTGVPLTTAVFLVLTVSFLTSIMGLGRQPEAFAWKDSVKAALIRMVGIFPGTAMARLTLDSPDLLRAVVGLTVGVGVVCQVLKLRQKTGAPDLPEYPPSAPLAPYAFAGSGFFLGWLGMGGPPLVFWLLTGRQSAQKTRAFLFGVYTTTVPFQLALMSYLDPSLPSKALPTLGVALPFCLALGAMACKYGERLDPLRLQKLSLILLTLVALKALWG